MTIRKKIASLLAVALCFSLLAVPAAAYERVDTTKEVSLELSYTDTEREFAVSGMELRIYKVFDMSDSVRFTITSDFQAYEDDLSLEDMDAEKWAALANTIAGYAARDQIQPLQTATTDEDGSVLFQGLTVGLYLVVGDPADFGSYTYTPTSFMITLPYLNADDTWSYAPKANGKFARDHDSGSTTFTRTALKVWDDAGYEDSRPEEVTVQLLRNGEVYDTVTLNEGNNWKHRWYDLSARYQWQVVEDNVPDDYTVLVEQEGNTYVITNTISADIDDPDIPEGPGPGTDPGTDPGTEPGTGEPGDGGDGEFPPIDIPDDPTPGGSLPQTGILWWPVQVLTLAGILLFSAGWLEIRRGKRNQDET